MHNALICSFSISRSPSFGNKSSKVDVLIVCVEYEFGRSNDSKMNSVLWVLQRRFIHNMR